MESTAASGGAAWEDDDDWELCNDAGFVFKRRKRRRLDSAADSAVQAPPSPSAEGDTKNLRREWKRNSLLKLKARHQKEIDQWELLSSTLRAMERTLELQQQRRLEEQEREQMAFLAGSGSSELQGSESACGSLVDELLLQAETQEAFIRDVSNLCDIADAICSSHEEQLTQSLIDLPIWASPQELMASLCDQ